MSLVLFAPPLPMASSFCFASPTFLCSFVLFSPSLSLSLYLLHIKNYFSYSRNSIQPSLSRRLRLFSLHLSLAHICISHNSINYIDANPICINISLLINFTIFIAGTIYYRTDFASLYGCFILVIVVVIVVVILMIFVYFSVFIYLRWNQIHGWYADCCTFFSAVESFTALCCCCCCIFLSLLYWWSNLNHTSAIETHELTTNDNVMHHLCDMNKWTGEVARHTHSQSTIARDFSQSIRRTQFGSWIRLCFVGVVGFGMLYAYAFIISSILSPCRSLTLPFFLSLLVDSHAYVIHIPRFENRLLSEDFEWMTQLQPMLSIFNVDGL